MRNLKGCSYLLSEKLDYPQSKVLEILNEFFALCAKEMREGDGVRVVGFGKFLSKMRATSKARDPRHPEKIIIIPAVRVPHFYAGEKLKRYLKKEQ